MCAVTGLTRTSSGQGLGAEGARPPAELEPVLSCRLLLPEGTDPHTALDKLRALEEEDPQLHLLWNQRLGQIRLQLMGPIQLEVLRQVAAQRFGLEVDFAPGAGDLHIGEPVPLAVPADLVHPRPEVRRVGGPGAVLGQRKDGVQAHTRTLWRLLERHHLPVFLFVNKMDLPGTAPKSAG